MMVQSVFDRLMSSMANASTELSLLVPLCTGPRVNVPYRRVASPMQGLGDRLSLKNMVWKYGHQYKIEKVGYIAYQHLYSWAKH